MVAEPTTRGSSSPHTEAATFVSDKGVIKSSLHSSGNGERKKSPRRPQTDGFPVPKMPPSVSKSHRSRRDTTNSPCDLAHRTFTAYRAHSERRHVSQTPWKLQELLGMYSAMPTTTGTRNAHHRDINSSATPNSLHESRMQFLSQTRSQVSLQRTQSPHVSLEALGGGKSPSLSEQLPFDTSFVRYEYSRSNTSAQPPPDGGHDDASKTLSPPPTDDGYDAAPEASTDGGPIPPQALPKALSPTVRKKDDISELSPSAARAVAPLSARKAPRCVDKKQTGSTGASDASSERELSP